MNIAKLYSSSNNATLKLSETHRSNLHKGSADFL